MSLKGIQDVAKQLPRSSEANTFALPAGSQNYQTPADVRAALDAVYHFDAWDPCPINAEGLRQVDGLGQTPAWVKRYFYNPPYSDVDPWLLNSIRDWERGVLSCVLIKADTSTNWMHDHVFPYARPIWIRGRLHFRKPGYCKTCKAEVCRSPTGHPAPFNSAAVVYEPGKLAQPQSVMWKDKAGVWHIAPTITQL